MNTLKSKFISALSSLVLLLSISTYVSAAEVNLGGFSGTLNTTITSGFSMRTENNDCRLISGDSLNPDGAGVEDRSSFTSYIGYNPDNGNGGCNVYETDSYGNTSNKTLSRVNSNQDDGKLNFGRGDVFDAGNTLSLEFLGSNSEGMSLNVSATAYYNGALEINAPSFKDFTSDQSDYFEHQYKLGNAYISAPLNNDVNITVGNYVQSQGVTALLPIGVNVVNPVNLPLLRSPGAQLKDALLPQAMVGMSAYLDGGITLEAYYQLEQKEVELDAAGSFYGSDFVGKYSSTDLMNSPNYRENKNIPFAGNYHDAATCFAAGGTAGGCADASLYAGIDTDGSGTPTRNGEYYGYYNQYVLGAGGSASLITAYNDVEANTDVSDLDGLITGALGAYSALINLGPGAQKNGVTLTDTQINTSLSRLWTQWGGVGVSSGLVSVSRAADIHAKDDGQFGINLSGYIDDIGNGVEWGLYFNNSHSNAPRVRFLTSADGYAATLDAMYGLQDSIKSYTDTDVSTFEQYQSSVAYGSLICGVVYKALAGSAAPYGTFAQNATSTASYLHDPGKCYATIDTLAAVGGAAAWTAQQAGLTSTTYANEAAAIAATKIAAHGQGTGATNGAIATLGFGNAARYQLYYPEDIQTIGASLATGVGAWSTNFEVAYRPDYPFQISVPQLLLNVYDSTGGTMIQSLTSYATASNANKAAIANAGAVSLNKWSSQPNCDISSATGEMSTAMSGYAVCDGTAEFDAWSFDFNAARSFAASDPITLGAGADSGFILVEIGGVYIPQLDSAQGLVATNHQSFGHDNYGGGCVDIAGTTSLAVQNNALFGDGYCEASSEADNLAMTSRIRAGMSYFNFNNSQWTFSPSLGLDYDFLGNGASALGGYVEDKMKLTLGSSFTNSGTSISLNYVAELGDFKDNSSADRDYVSATLSHAF